MMQESSSRMDLMREKLTEFINDSGMKTTRFKVYKSEVDKVKKFLEDFGEENKYEYDFLPDSGSQKMMVISKKK